MSQEDRLAKLEKRSKDRILLRISGDIRERKNLSCSIVTRGQSSMEPELGTLQRYNPQNPPKNAEHEDFKVSKVPWSFFTTIHAWVVSTFFFKNL